MVPVRRSLSILLLVLFGLPFVSSLFAAGSATDTGVPACCRRNGTHHCLMSMTERSQISRQGDGFAAIPERCPYCPGVVTATHADWLTAPTGEAIFAGLVSHPASEAQTESKRRVSRDRSRQKRGPPSTLLS